jgi:hypothetical protein
MASLQIRDMPEAVHRLLQLRALQNNRSLAQQALTDLESACGSDRALRRRQSLDRLSTLWRDHAAVNWPESPEAMVRADRDR